MGLFDAARLLINNGADLYQINESGKSAYDLITDSPFRKRQLVDSYRLVKYNMSIDALSLTTLSLFSRHPERLESAKLAQLLTVKELFNTEEGLDKIEHLLK